uniref:Uncharacterized protein n=2 Tax=Hemiselmis andersenii TaxID=464988 RepID=A0A7S0U6W6_HEMAN
MDGLQPKLEKELGMRATRTEPPEGEDTSSAGSVPPPLFMLLVSSLVLTVSDGSLSFEWGHHQEDLAHRAWAIISSSLALPPGLLPLKSSRSLTFPPASPMFSPTSPNYNPPSPDYTPTNDALEQSRSEPMMPTSPSEAPPPTPGAKRPKIKMENE